MFLLSRSISSPFLLGNLETVNKIVDDTERKLQNIPLLYRCSDIVPRVRGNWVYCRLQVPAVNYSSGLQHGVSENFTENVKLGGKIFRDKH
jgi:hypothetical protein